MKYIFFLFIFIISNLDSAIAQTEFGIRVGANFTFYNENQGQFGENPEIETGYFGGFFVNVKMNDYLNIQPELLYKGVGDFHFINAPIYAEYYVAKDFSLLMGPSINYFFDLFVNRFKIRADVSAAYHISENVDINLKYTLGFRELAPNVLFLGIGFNL